MMMSLDCLIGNMDVQATVERDEFETAAAPLVVQAVSQCVSSLWKSVFFNTACRSRCCKSCSPSAASRSRT